jgi:hypothetical protein
VSPQYVLIRTLPTGEERRHSPLAFPRAVQAAAHVLRDNGYAARRDAEAFAATLRAAPLGEDVEHVSGYRFRIEKS